MKKMQDRNVKLMKDLNQNYKLIEEETQEHFIEFLEKWKKLAKSKIDQYKSVFVSLKEEKEDIQSQLKVILQDLQEKNKQLVEEYSKLIEKYHNDLEAERKDHKGKVELMESAYDDELSKLKQERIELDSLLEGLKSQKELYESKSKDLRGKMKEKEVMKREQFQAILQNYSEDCARLVMKGIVDEVEAEDNIMRSEKMRITHKKEIESLKGNIIKLEKEKDTLKNHVKRVGTATSHQNSNVQNVLEEQSSKNVLPPIDYEKYDGLVILKYKQICKISSWKREFAKKEKRKCEKADCAPIKDMFIELKSINNKLEECRGNIREGNNNLADESYISVDTEGVEEIAVANASSEELERENKKLSEEIKQLRATMAGKVDETSVIKDLKAQIEKANKDAEEWKKKYKESAVNNPNKPAKKDQDLNESVEKLKKENTQLQERLYFFKSRAQTMTGGIPATEDTKKEDTFKKEYEKILQENQEQLKQIQELEPIKVKLIESEALLSAKEKEFNELREKYQKVGLERVALGKENLKYKQQEAERTKIRSELANEAVISSEDQKTKEEMKILLKEHETLSSQHAQLVEENQNSLAKIAKLEKENAEILEKMASLRRFENDAKELERTQQQLTDARNEANQLRLQMAMGLPEAPEDKNTLIKEDYEKMVNENKEIKEKIEQLQKKMAGMKEIKRNLDEKSQESFVLRQDTKRLQIENEEATRKAEQVQELKAKIAEMRLQLADRSPGESSNIRQEMRKVVEENKNLQAKADTVDQANKNFMQFKSLAESTMAELAKVKQELKKTELERDGLKLKADKATTYLMERNSARVELAKLSKGEEFGMPTVGESSALKVEMTRLATENEKLLKNVELTEKVKKDNLVKDERIKDLEGKFKASKDKIKDLEQQLSKNIDSRKKEDIEKIKNDNKELEKLLEKERQISKSLRADIDKTTKKYDSLREKEVKELEEKIKTLEAQHKQDMILFEKSTNEEIGKRNKELENAKNEINKLTEDNASLLQEKTDLGEKVNILSQNIQRLEADIAKLKNAEAQAIGLAEKVQQLSEQIEKEKADYIIMDKKYKDEMLQRKRLHNIIEDMKGKIRVYCRVRPISTKEKEMGSASIVNIMDEFTVKVDTKYGPKLFNFDSAFGPEATQEKVFEDTKRLVQSAVDGFNVCFFAYGQTGAGKSHTIQGTDQMPGIAPRSFEELQKIMHSMNNYSYTLECYMVELYLDTVTDLLLSKDQRKNPPHLDIKEDIKGTMYVQNATRHPIFTAEDAKKIFDTGLNNRKTFATEMNDNSSRSHLIFSILIECVNKQTSQRTTGKMSFVDLAGSERATKAGTSAERLKEGRAINKSLSALGDVISILSSNSNFMDFNIY